MFTLLSHAWRSWKHAKAVAVLAIAALALGIGSTTAIYTVVQAVLLNPLPYANPDRYLTVIAHWRGISGGYSAWSYPNCVDFARGAHTLEAFGCVAAGKYNVVLRGLDLHADGAEVSPEFVNALGIRMRLGRWFSAKPEPHVAVISEHLWRLTGSDPQIVGKTLTVNAVPFVVSGVAPAWFRFPIDGVHNDLWAPLDPAPDARTSRGDRYMYAFAKMRPGVTLSGASADLSRIAARLEGESPDEKNHIVSVQSLLSNAVAYVRPSLLILLFAAAALLLIACGNVASLLLARAVARQRETAVRIALGASAAQLSAQYMSEGIAVALAGAALGTLVSVVLVRMVLSMAADVLPRADQIHLDWRVLGVTFVTAIVCGMLFSLAPLWQGLRTAPNRVLTSGVRASANRASRRLLRLLVTGEIALSFLLLAVAGLFLGRMNILFHIDPGFDAQNLTAFSIYLPPEKFATKEQRVGEQTRLLQTVRSIVGVQNAAFTSILPLSGGENDIFAAPDHEDLNGFSIVELAKTYDYEIRFVSDQFFETMRIRWRSGADFKQVDPAASVQPVVISETVARKLWPGRSALGHTLNLGDSKIDFRVAGLVQDVRENLAKESRGHIYISYRSVWPGSLTMRFVVRSKLPVDAFVPRIRRAVAAVDVEAPIFDVQPMDELVSGSLGRERLQSFVISFFGGAALVLSLLGVYGVVSYSVRQRIPEMGTRLALGATGNNLIGMVLREALQTAALGSVAGIVLMMAVAQLFSSLDVEVSDFRPYLAALVLVGAATLLASAAPAITAGAVAPIIALGNGTENLRTRVRRSYRRVARTVSALLHPGEHSSSEMAILADVADSTGQATSFNDAIRAALSTVVEKTNASGATLMVRRSPDQPFRCLSAIPENGHSWTLPQETLLLNRLRHFYPGLPITQGDLDAFERWAQERHSGRLAEIATLTAIGPAAALPVTVKDETVGILFVNPEKTKASFDPGEMRLLRSVAAQFALMLENSRLTDRIVEQDRLKRDLALATEVQQRLFPEHAPEIKTAHLAGFCLPARGVGGDLYDFLRLDRDQIGIVIADVAGKGIAAALVTSIIQASVRSLAGTDGDSPAALAAKVNKLLCASTGPSSYATFFYAKFDETNRTLSYVNGGHNPPLLLHSATGQMEELAAGGMIIGMFPFCTYEQTDVELYPGDVLIAYTDGVSEAHNPAEEEFTDERLKDLLRTYADQPVDEMSRNIFDRLKDWMQDAPQHDDLTFVLLKVH